MEYIELYRGDITKIKVDAIVNAANTSLLGGGGVDGAIHNAAGPQLREECSGHGGCPTGQARITNGYRLPAKYVIHAVGPVWKGGKFKESVMLQSCYRSALDLAEGKHAKSIAFPAISTGVFGYPAEEAAGIAVKTVRDWLKCAPTINRIVFVVYNDAAENVYRKLLT